MRGTDRRCPLAFLACVLTTFAGRSVRRASSPRSRSASRQRDPAAGSELRKTAERGSSAKDRDRSRSNARFGVGNHPSAGRRGGRDAHEEFGTLSIRVREAARPFAFAHKLPIEHPFVRRFRGLIWEAASAEKSRRRRSRSYRAASRRSRLVTLIDQARSRIDLMIYGWQDDPTGREVATEIGRTRTARDRRPPVGRSHRFPHPQSRRGAETDVSRRTQARAQRLRDRTPFAVLSARSP